MSLPPDPNRVAVNLQLQRQAAQQAALRAQQQAESRARAQAAYQAQVEERKRQEAEEDAIRAANARARNDRLSPYNPANQQQAKTQGGMTQDQFTNFFNTERAKGTLVNDLQKMGIKVDAVTFKTDASGKVSNIQGVKFLDTGTNPQNNNFSAAQNNQEMFGSYSIAQAKQAIQNPTKMDIAGTKAGYAQLQGAEKQAGAYYSEPVFGSMTAAQVATALYGPNVKAKQAVQDFNITQGYDIFKAKQEQQSSNRNNTASGDSFYYNPLMPFIKSKNPDDSNLSIGFPNQPINPLTPSKDSFEAGFTNYFTNIGKFGIDVGQRAIGKGGNVQYSPEAEGAFVGALVNAGKRSYDGKPIDVNLSLLGKDLGDLAGAIEKNPSYYAGSIAASAAFTAATFGFGKIATGAKALKGVFEVGTIAGKAERTAVQTAKEFGIADEGIGIQAFKTSKTGQEIPLAQTGKIFTQERTFGLNLPKGNSLIDIPFSNMSLRVPGRVSATLRTPAIPETFAITKTTGKEGASIIEDLGVFSTKTDKGVFNVSGIGQAEKEMLTGTKIIPSKSIQEIGLGLDIASPTSEAMKGARAPASGIIDVFQSEAKVLKNVGPPSLAGKAAPDIGNAIVRPSKTEVKIAESRFTGGTLAEFTPSKMLGFAKQAEKSALTPEEKAIFGVANKKQLTPFDFGKAVGPRLEKGSRSALETISEFDFDRGLMRQFVEPTAKASSSAFSKTAAGAILGDLGISVMVGTSRVRPPKTSNPARDILDTKAESILDMGISERTSTRARTSTLDIVKELSSKASGSRGAFDTQSFTRSLLDVGTRQQSRQDQSLGIFSGLEVGSMLDLNTDNIFTPISGTGLDTQTTQTTKTTQTFDIPKFEIPTPRTPNESKFKFELGFGPSKPIGKRKRGKKSKYYKKTTSTADIIRGAGFSKADSKRFQRMFGKF